MLKFITSDPDDIELLESSYNSIRQKDCLEIIVDEDEKKKIFQQTVNSISIPLNATFSFVNLFKITLASGSFYIAQCLIDFGYPAKSSIHKYDFQLIGIAKLKIDLGKTFLRPETKVDKLVGRFFDHDIDFADCEHFNDKYYLVSSKKEQVYKAFDNSFLKTLAKYNDILLTTRNHDLYITFARELHSEQARIIEDVLSSCNFLDMDDIKY